MSISLLQNKVAVVSGGMGYLGSFVVKKLAEQGMKVAVIYKNAPQGEVDDFVATLPGSHHKAYSCDLRDNDSVVNTVENIEQDMGSIFVCVHASGEKPTRKKILLTTADEMKKQIDGNIMSSFYFLIACAKKMKESNEGIIIGVTTAGVVVKEATQSLGAYIPAKCAVQGILVMLHEELRNTHVHVYSVAPGFMSGGMNKDIPEAFVEIIRAKSATKKITTGEEVAERIVDICVHPDDYKDTTIIIAPEYE